MYLLLSIVMLLFLTSGNPAPAAESVEIMYEVRMENPLSHLFQIQMRFSTPDPDGAKLAMPAWTPGYYDITNPARNLQEMEAEDGSGQKLKIEKLDKLTWRILKVGNSDLIVRYKVYANRLTVDGAQLNDSHGYFNGAFLFPCLVGHRNDPCRLKVVAPKGWSVATALKPAGEPGQFAASNYDELVDSPVEAGQFRELEFSVKGIPCRAVVHGQSH
ncbi:MAG: peptidase M61, partial [Armatimonadetes bacterium]|nr:peptidase M61 [Armatimonadota bacterium]